MWLCLWGRGQRGNNAAGLLVPSPQENGLSCETGSFSHYSNHHSPVHSQLWGSVSPSASPAHLVHCSRWFFWAGLASAVCWLTGLVVLTFSLIPWLSEFHAVWFFGASGCLLILDWLLSYFWLCEEAKGFYICLHLGQNSRESFHTSIGHLYVLFGDVSIRVIYPFENWIVCFLVFSFVSSL